MLKKRPRVCTEPSVRARHVVPWQLPEGASFSQTLVDGSLFTLRPSESIALRRVVYRLARAHWRDGGRTHQSVGARARVQRAFSAVYCAVQDASRLILTPDTVRAVASAMHAEGNADACTLEHLIQRALVLGNVARSRGGCSDANMQNRSAENFAILLREPIGGSSMRPTLEESSHRPDDAGGTVLIPKGLLARLALLSETLDGFEVLKSTVHGQYRMAVDLLRRLEIDVGRISRVLQSLAANAQNPKATASAESAARLAEDIQNVLHPPTNCSDTETAHLQWQYRDAEERCKRNGPQTTTKLQSTSWQRVSKTDVKRMSAEAGLQTAEGGKGVEVETDGARGDRGWAERGNVGNSTLPPQEHREGARPLQWRQGRAESSRLGRGEGREETSGAKEGDPAASTAMQCESLLGIRGENDMQHERDAEEEIRKTPEGEVRLSQTASRSKAHRAFASSRAVSSGGVRRSEEEGSANVSCTTVQTIEESYCTDRRFLPRASICGTVEVPFEASANAPGVVAVGGSGSVLFKGGDECKATVTCISSAGQRQPDVGTVGGRQVVVRSAERLAEGESALRIQKHDIPQHKVDICLQLSRSPQVPRFRGKSLNTRRVNGSRALLVPLVPNIQVGGPCVRESLALEVDDDDFSQEIISSAVLVDSALEIVPDIALPPAPRWCEARKVSARSPFTTGRVPCAHSALPCCILMPPELDRHAKWIQSAGSVLEPKPLPPDPEHLRRSRLRELRSFRSRNACLTSAKSLATEAGCRPSQAPLVLPEVRGDPRSASNGHPFSCCLTNSAMLPSMQLVGTW